MILFLTDLSTSQGKFFMVQSIFLALTLPKTQTLQELLLTKLLSLQILYLAKILSYLQHILQKELILIWLYLDRMLILRNLFSAGLPYSTQFYSKEMLNLGTPSLGDILALKVLYSAGKTIS